MSYNQEVDAPYFATYDDRIAQVKALAGAEADLAAAKRKLSEATSAEKRAEGARKGNEKAVAKLKSRIEQAENSCFFSCCGGEAKVERLQAQLDAEEGKAGALVDSEGRLEEKLEVLTAEVRTAEELVARKAALVSESSSMFESAVQSHPSEKMLYLQRAAADCRANVDFEAANTAALENVGRMCVTARGAYLAAIRALDAAQSTNRGAQFNNVLGGRNGGLELMENIQQMKRNNLMQEAQAQAQRGGEILASALAQVPPPARERYPGLCQGLGDVYIPTLEQMGLGSAMMEVFGGDLMDAMAGMRAGQKIRHGLDALQRCEAVVAQQEGLLRALLEALRRDGNAAAAKLAGVQQELAAEKETIWEALREAVGAPPPKGEGGRRSYAVAQTQAEAHKAAATLQQAVRASKVAVPVATPVSNLSVAVPVGASPGDLITVQTPRGQYRVAVPPGVKEGARFEFALP
mmetsp:Transcript_8442/g.27269  ORF Transcript_8442/g.27269 Transcript_8442/m.27269 type:complete len:464 (+) Transcript_8442:79-1470(+)